MQRISALWKAIVIAFASSFCVMVIELVAARILAPHIGVSLYTWTSIIGVILAGIALGNFVGGKVADRYPSPLLLTVIFFVGALLTVAILPATRFVSEAGWFGGLPIMWHFVFQVALIFFLPAVVLSTVSPLVIKLTLGSLNRTGGVVGTIYACSTAGSILGTFMTGFYFVLWFGTAATVWLVGAVLFLIGVLVWCAWEIPGRWRPTRNNLIAWAVIVVTLAASVLLYALREDWQTGRNEAGEITEGTYTVTYATESNYFTIRVLESGNVKALSLDRLIHSVYYPDQPPTTFFYPYLRTLEAVTGYLVQDNLAPRLLHLGGGGYSFPRYMEYVYPDSINEVVEIDPLVTKVVHRYFGLAEDTSIITYNQDGRLFFIQRHPETKYDVVIGDVFSDRSTPYHLTTLEFDRLVRDSLNEGGVYLVHCIDIYGEGRYMPALVNTLQHAFGYVYIFGDLNGGEGAIHGSFVIAATDTPLDVAGYQAYLRESGLGLRYAPVAADKLEEYLAARDPILLTDDYAPTDILVAPIQSQYYK